MAGLNHGYKYCIRKQKYPQEEGVFFVPQIGKWVVRVKRRGGFTTLGQRSEKQDAETLFENRKNENADRV